MKITALAQHLHQLRHNRSGRAIGNSMQVAEVWNSVLESDKTSIDQIDVVIEDMPSPVDGMFSRIAYPDKEIGVVHVNKKLPEHWRDFVIIKEMMHCFTPLSRYCPTPDSANDVLTSLVKRAGRYTTNVAADNVAILAAAEVILPHTTILSLLSVNQDVMQIATRHNLHHEIAEEICRVDSISWRRKASILGDF